MPIKVLVPLTTKLEVPVLLVIVLAPVMDSEPTVTARCKSKLAAVMVSKLVALPRVPVLVTAKIPPLIVVAPP